VARRVGCSVQHLRDLEGAGVVPPATRTSSGHRVWNELHVLSATACRELTRAVGPAPAKDLLRALHHRPAADFLALLDAAHAELHRQRHDLRLAREAVVSIAAEPVESPRPSDAMTITQLATALGTTTATLRHWEAQGLLAPRRTGPGRVRTFTPLDVRDVRVVHQLRTAGHPIPQVRTVLRTLAGSPGSDAALRAGLELRDEQLTGRSRSLLRASAALHDLLTTMRPVAGPAGRG
jgi:DNA-binding transcriptional MerR regulator